MKLTGAAIHDESAIQKWLICLLLQQRHGAASIRETRLIKKQLPLWFGIVFFFWFSNRHVQKSIWDFQEPATPLPVIR